jgi:16S rRNA (uracil1498-N3)-methyltransferase
MRQFVVESEIDAEGRIRVSPKDVHYLGSVLRLRDGDGVEVRLRDGTLTRMHLAGEWLVDEGAGAAAAGEFLAGCRFSLLQFLPKAPKFDLIVRQAVEVGVTAIVPIRGEYSPPLGEGRLGRWQKIVKAARQQCGSPVDTEILPVTDLEKAIAWWKKEGGAGFMLDEKPNPALPLPGVHPDFSFGKSAAVAVGCEGGISPGERTLLLEAGFAPLHFPTNILRCETAALYGMAVVQGMVWRVNG